MMKNILVLLALINFIHIYAIDTVRQNIDELPFVISICAYNNAEYVKKNLDSIFCQKYSNYRVVYVDDCSTDSTALNVLNYREANHLQEKLILRVNTKRSLKMKNIYNVFHSCDDDEIIVQVDGDDWLAHDGVLNILNHAYQTNNIWLTHGQFVGHDGSQLGICKPVPVDIIEQRAFRSWKWVYTHVRTFYAWLFKSIKLEDLINENVEGFEGKFFPAANDLAIYFPMLEMCGEKFYFIDEVLYIYNRDNPNLTSKVSKNLQNHASKDIRGRSKYDQLFEPELHRLDAFKKCMVDLIILAADNNPEIVKPLLDSLTYVLGIKDIYLLHDAKHTEFNKLPNLYPNLYCLSDPHQPIEKLLNAVLDKSEQKHFLVTDGKCALSSSLNIHECILDLEKTFAYGVYLGYAASEEPFYNPEVHQEQVPHEHIFGDVYAWKFSCKNKRNDSGHLYNALDMTLLKKQTLELKLQKIASSQPHTANPSAAESSVASFIRSWHRDTHQDQHTVGILYKTSKIHHHCALSEHNN